MKKLVAIILSILFCMTLTCCGTEDVLAGLPEITKDNCVYYDGAKIEYGEGLDEARAVSACPYTEIPTVEQAEADGAFITVNYGDRESVVKNMAALERFAYNVNHGVEDSLLWMLVSYYDNGNENISANFLYYKDGELKNATDFAQPETDKVLVSGDNVKVFPYRKSNSTGYCFGGLHILRSSMDGIGTEYFRYTYSHFTPVTESSQFYEEGAMDKFVNVAGIHEGDGGETKLYEKYPFEESCPTAKQVFDIGGAVIFDTESITKTYNAAVIARFQQNIIDGIADTLFVYIDDGSPATVMYTFTGDSLIFTNDMRASAPDLKPYTAEIFGDLIRLGNDKGSLDYEDICVVTPTERKIYTRHNFIVHYTETLANGESHKAYVHEMVEIPPIQYVTEHIVPESEAKNYK